MSFNEANTIEAFIRDLLCGGVNNNIPVGPGLARVNNKLSGLGWHYLSKESLSRQAHEAIVEDQLRQALIRLNPCIAKNHDRASEIIYRLRAIIMAVRSDGLVKANEEFFSWVTGEKSMPFGDNAEHITIKIIDFENLEQNQYVITQQYTFRSGKEEKRADLVLIINGIPLVVIEAKTPVRASQSWIDGALQIHDKYEPIIPELFVSNAFSIATEGKELRYGSIRMPIEFWGPWRLEDENSLPTLEEIGNQIKSMLRPNVILDLISNFTSYATYKGKQRIKIVARYQQYDGANKLVNRVIKGHPKKGLIWHFQGSGKSLLMLFAARKLRLHQALKNPTIIILVDRIDLDSQISSTFYSNNAANLIKAESRKDLQELLNKDVRKIIITTIHKFGESDGILNPRTNIICLADEAHRSQEGDLGRKMRRALPNAFLFGLTGTPINKSDKNTFYAFGSEEDENGYMSRYSFEDSIRDGATKELHFEPRLIELHVDNISISEEYEELTKDLTDEERDKLSKTAAKMAILLKAPKRIKAVCKDIAKHFQDKVLPNSFAGQVVTFDRESCILYKQELDKLLPAESTAVVMSVNSGENEYADYRLDRDAEEKLLDRFRDPSDPLKLIIVTSKLLTGFDAPILQTMYLDRPLRDHTLLQAICRTNRPYGQNKTHGLIVDYLGVFDDVAQALQFDEDGISKVISNIDELIKELPEAIQKCLAYFQGVDRTISGYEGLQAAQECLPNNKIRDQYAADTSYLMRLWEAISPDPILSNFQQDYRWLIQVYESLKPVDNTGNLLWHRLGSKTIELIHEGVNVNDIQDDLETLVIDAEFLNTIMGSPDPEGEGKKLEIKIAKRLRNRLSDPRFKALGERLEDLRKRHQQGLLMSVAFLKELLELAKDLVAAEETTPSVNPDNEAKDALTELFLEVKSEKTPIIVEKIVNDIDKIVKEVRFEGWQATHAGEREVRKALRKTLFHYKLHTDKVLFSKAYSYIEKYY